VDDSLHELETCVATILKTARPGDQRSRIPAGLTPDEACWFLEALAPHGDEPALLEITREGRTLSKCYPLRKNGEERRYRFPTENASHDQETLVHWSAVGRLHHQFNWPRQYILCESARVVKDGEIVIKQDAVDILLLEQPRESCPWKVNASDLRSLIVAEVKRSPALVDDLIKKMRRCQRDDAQSHDEHNKCLAIDALDARYFLAIGASDTWRLFETEEADGHRVLGSELSPDPSTLYFQPR
jgi:hypothetical protein